MTVDADAFNRFEAAGWADRAEGYHGFFERLTSRFADALLDAAGVGPETRLLDVATGPGYVAAAAEARGATAAGVDLSPSMVTLARRLNPRLAFHEGDAEALPFADASFDAAVGNFLILHVGRPERVAAELARVLVPGGRAALTTWDVPERVPFFELLLGALADAGAELPPDVPEGPAFFRFSDDAEFERLLDSAGFEEVAVRTVALRRFRFGTPEEVWEGFLRGAVRTAAIVARQPVAMRRRIREAFERRAEAHLVDGAVETPVSVKLASGRKPG